MYRLHQGDTAVFAVVSYFWERQNWPFLQIFTLLRCQNLTFSFTNPSKKSIDFGFSDQNSDSSWPQ